MTEELKQEVVGVVGAAGEVPVRPETTPAPEPVAGKSEEPGAEIPAEYAALIAQQVKAQTEALRKEYEGEGGHISKLKSTKDKEIARLQRQVAEKQEVDRRRALDLMESDPAAAAKDLAAQVQALTQQTQYQQFESQMDGYVRKSVEDLGLDIEDEETAKRVAGWMPRLLEDQTLEGAFQHDLAKINNEQKDKLVSQLRKQVDAQKEEIPKLIARALEEAGIGKVDLSPDGSPGKGSVHSKLPGKNIQDGLAAERKELERRQQQ